MQKSSPIGARVEADDLPINVHRAAAWRLIKRERRDF